MWLVRESVYGFTLPSGLSDWLSVLEPLGFDLGSFIFPDWKCVGGLTTRLAFNGLWPLVLMLVVALALTAREAAREGSIKNVALRSLEAAVFISFCALPSVTRSLFPRLPVPELRLLRPHERDQVLPDSVARH